MKFIFVEHVNLKLQDYAKFKTIEVVKKIVVGDRGAHGPRRTPRDIDTAF